MNGPLSLHSIISRDGHMGPIASVEQVPWEEVAYTSSQQRRCSAACGYGPAGQGVRCSRSAGRA